MAIKIVPDKIFDMIASILEYPGITLIKESTAKAVGLTDENIDDVAYNFGGEADVWVDLVSSDQHLFIAEAKEQGVIPE
jgi:hypothetical protein